MLVWSFRLWYQVKQTEIPWTAQHRSALDSSKRFPESLSDQAHQSLCSGVQIRNRNESHAHYLKAPWIERMHVGAAAWPCSVVGVRKPGGLRSDCKDAHAEPSCGEAERARAGRTDSAKGMPAKWRAVLAHRTGKEGHGRIGSTRKIW